MQTGDRIRPMSASDFVSDVPVSTFPAASIACLACVSLQIGHNVANRRTPMLDRASHFAAARHLDAREMWKMAATNEDAAAG
jgi:hypothetical protein